MTKAISGNYLRIYRRKAGLSQPDLAAIIGHASAWQIDRHEKNKNVPPLLTALAYEALFNVPVSTLFIGLYETVEHGIQANLLDFEAQLESLSAAGKAKLVAHRLMWLSARRNAAKIQRPQL
jgi:DNA-binding XRE family transcriptional regulator